jgi:hypothetical protein
MSGIINSKPKPINPHFENVDENPELAAQKVLSQIEWDGVVPIDLVGICDMFDFELVFENRPDMKEDGTTELHPDGASCKIIINTKGNFPDDGFAEDPTIQQRQRFTLAHEIGHCIYASHQNRALQDDLARKDNPHGKSYARLREFQANEFAASLLMPTQHLKKVLRPLKYRNAQDDLRQISEIYNVSFQVAIQRIPKVENFPCITILFRDGKPIRMPSYSKSFVEEGFYFPRDQVIPDNTIADRMDTGKETGDYCKKVYSDTRTWFPSFRGNPDQYKVSEHSFNQGKFGITTFLAIECLQSYY